MSLKIIKNHLPQDEYFPSYTPKDSIYLHHTAGSHRPDWTIHSWNKDRSKSGNKIRIATSFVIGGRSTRDGNSDFDGKILEAFSPVYWAHHLGLKSTKNTFLNQKSIGIELCNYGPLTYTNDGRFFTRVNTEIPESNVVELSEPFRGNLFFQKYTERQIDSLQKLLYHLSTEFDINLTKGIQSEIYKSELVLPDSLSVKDQQKWLNKNGFRDSNGQKLKEDGILGPKTQQSISEVGKCALEIKYDAMEGYPGLWSHTNVRKDKTDIFPDPNLMEMLKCI